MKLQIRFSLFILLSLFSQASFATHIVGGEIFYNYLGGNNYLITLKMYRDCGPANVNGTDFDEFASIGIFNAQGILVQEELIPLESTNVSFIPVVLDNPCFILPPDVCVESAYYQTTVSLPPLVGGYTITYQRCCRQPSIDNILVPQDSGATYTTHIPGSDENSPQNSAPHFLNFPPPALCWNAEFTFDHSAFDPDGDSLVYSFCAPLLGADPAMPMPQPPSPPPYATVSYAPTFNANYPITSNPGFSINSSTGLITGTATQVGQFVMGICCREYRNGVLINTINRDFQFNVTMCDPSIIATIPDQSSFCNGNTVNFISESTNATTWYWDFGVITEINDTSNLENPTYTYANAGTYDITLIANPGWPCADTATSTYQVYPDIAPAITLGPYACINNHDEYSFLGSADLVGPGTFSWNFGAGSSPSSASVVHPQNIQLDPNVANNIITLTVTADNGCSETVNLTVPNPPDPVAAIVPQSTFCEGLTYTFQQTSLNSTDYWWEFNTSFNGDYSDESSPTFTFPDTGQYVIQLIASAPFTCPDTTTTSLEIYGFLNPSFPGQLEQCASTNSFDFTALGATTNEAIYSWDFGSNQVPNSTEQNPQNIHYLSSGTYVVSLTISENGCTETYIDDVWVPADPVLNPSILPAAGCPPVFGTFFANATADTQLFYFWDLGDGTTSNQQSVTHIYETPGSYDVSLMVYTVSGCIDTLYQAVANDIIVQAVPQASFQVSPAMVDILNPVMSITDNSVGGATVNYTMSDGGVSTEWNFEYTWTEAGQQTITQTITNEYGCVNSVTAPVFIQGFLFYAPNSFTPNQDGLNEVWLPICTGVTTYHLEIYDRWGVRIFESDDQNEAWIGNVHGGRHYAENGVYNYQVIMNDLLGLPHEFHGHIVLVR